MKRRRRAPRPDPLERVLLDLRARHLAYDVMVIAILAFVWLTPPDWLQRSDGLRRRAGLAGSINVLK